MKKIIFLLLATLAFGFSAIAQNGVSAKLAPTAVSAYDLVPVNVYLQTGYSVSGSTVTYHDGIGYVTESLRSITNSLRVKKGTWISLDITVMCSGDLEYWEDHCDGRGFTSFQRYSAGIPIVVSQGVTINSPMNIYFETKDTSENY